jgi:hypothetical protein
MILLSNYLIKYMQEMYRPRFKTKKEAKSIKN